MISANQYQDIEIQQGADFENVITFETSYGMSTYKQFVGKIQKDFANSSFTGPKKTNDNIGTEINIADATCDITDGSPNVTMDSTANIKAGMKITGSGLTGTTVQSITNSTTFVASSNSSVTGTNVTLTFNDTWASDSNITEIQFDLVASVDGKSVTLTLPAEATQYFTDDFEGVWELVEKDTTSSTNPIYTRHIQGDVVISKGMIQLDDTWKAAL